jgi:hypothetical protein
MSIRPSRPFKRWLRTYSKTINPLMIMKLVQRSKHTPTLAKSNNSRVTAISPNNADLLFLNNPA